MKIDIGENTLVIYSVMSNSDRDLNNREIQLIKINVFFKTVYL